MTDSNSPGSSEHVVVIGTGPAGLSAAHELSRHRSLVTVIEQEIQVGGIARTLEFMGCRFDVGPHRLKPNPWWRLTAQRLIVERLDGFQGRRLDRFGRLGRRFAAGLEAAGWGHGMEGILQDRLRRRAV